MSSLKWEFLNRNLTIMMSVYCSPLQELQEIESYSGKLARDKGGGTESDLADFH